MKDRTESGKSKDETNRILNDVCGAVHKSLFRAASHILSPNGSILLVESRDFSEPAEIISFANAAGLALQRYVPPPPISRALRSITVSNDSLLNATIYVALHLLEIYFVQFVGFGGVTVEMAPPLAIPQERIRLDPTFPEVPEVTTEMCE